MQCLLHQINYIVMQKNVPTLASCSFDKYEQILIIFGKQHQDTFNKNLAITNR